MSVFSAIKSFYSTNGRANRKEYWAWLSAVWVAFVVTVVAATLFGDNGVYDEPEFPQPLRMVIIAVPVVVMLILAFKMRSVSIRRRHDSEISERYRHLRWIPYVGPLLHFVMLGFLPTTRGDNAFGPDPRNKAIVDAFGDDPMPGPLRSWSDTDRREPRF